MGGWYSLSACIYGAVLVDARKNLNTKINTEELKKEVSHAT